MSGNQVTDVGHRVFLPEEWERATAARIATRSTIAGAIGVLLLVAGLVALLRYLKRPPVVSAIPWPSRGRMLSVLALVGVVMVLLGANGWPANMYGWDTASPFNRHQWTSVLGLLGNLLVPAVFWGLWLVADAARRRMGVPLRSSSAREAWIVGGALALGPVLQRAVSWWLSPTSWSTPSTTMNQLVPGIEGITTVVSGALTVVPLFVLAAGALLFIRSRMQRMVAVVVVALLMGVMGSAGSTVTTAEWLQHAFTEAVGFCLLAAVLWRYGNSSVEAWLAGGIILTLAPQVAAMVQAGVAVDRISHALGIVVGIAVAVWVIGQRRALVESA